MVQAARIEVTDAEGRIRAVVGELDEPSEPQAAFGLRLFDEHGEVRLAVVLTALGPSVSMMAGGNVVVDVGFNDPLRQVLVAGPYLMMRLPTGTGGIGFGVDRDGETWHTGDHLGQ